jgi:chaperone required for assembly of F1-ATPase
MKRFWKEVTIVASDDGLSIALDDRPVRTPGRALLAVPTRALIDAIADEWRGVGATIDPRAMPLTGLANAAIDRVATDPIGFAAGLTAYGESDLLCYRAEAPPPLVDRQNATWNPVLDWARARYDVHFAVTAGIIHTPQPPATLARLADALAARTPFELAALSPIVTISGSLVLALMLAEGAIDPDAAWNAAHLDEQWQAQMWGEDDLAIGAREARRQDFNAGVQFLEALKAA